MKVFYSIDEVKIEGKPVATLGTFDGVHLGHRELIKHLISESSKRGTCSLLITFDPHPRIVLNKSPRDLKFINSPQEKIQLLSQLGLDYLLVLPFTFEFSKTSANSFIQHYLIEKLHVQAMTIGYDHHFGRMDGEYENVELLLRAKGIDVERIPELDVESMAVSSTKIREAVQNGKMDLAKQMLNYPFRLCGTVVHGNKIGRTIGFPTANLMLEYPFKLIPADGVYAVVAIVNQQRYQGMLNIGFRPTIQSNQHGLEVHILDFEKLIYGEKIEVEVLSKIREEISFQNIDSLAKQLQADRLWVQNYFAQFVQ